VRRAHQTVQIRSGVLSQATRAFEAIAKVQARVKQRVPDPFMRRTLLSPEDVEVMRAR